MGTNSSGDDENYLGKLASGEDMSTSSDDGDYMENVSASVEKSDDAPNIASGSSYVAGPLLHKYDLRNRGVVQKNEPSSDPGKKRGSSLRLRETLNTSKQIIIAKSIKEETEGRYTLSLQIDGRPPANYGMSNQGDHSTAFRILQHAVEANVNDKTPELALANMISLISSTFSRNSTLNDLAWHSCQEAIKRYSQLNEEISHPEQIHDELQKVGKSIASRLMKTHNYYRAGKIGDIVVDLVNSYITTRNKMEFTSFSTEGAPPASNDEGSKVATARRSLMRLEKELRAESTIIEMDSIKRDVVKYMRELLHYPWVPDHIKLSTDKKGALIKEKKLSSTNCFRDNDTENCIKVLQNHLVAMYEAFPIFFEKIGGKELTFTFVQNFIANDNAAWLIHFAQSQSIHLMELSEDDLYNSLYSMRDNIAMSTYFSLPGHMRELEEESSMSYSDKVSDKSSQLSSFDKSESDDRDSISDKLSTASIEQKTELSSITAIDLCHELQKRADGGNLDDHELALIKKIVETRHKLDF